NVTSFGKAPESKSVASALPRAATVTLKLTAPSSVLPPVTNRTATSSGVAASSPTDCAAITNSTVAVSASRIVTACVTLPVVVTVTGSAPLTLDRPNVNVSSPSMNVSEVGSSVTDCSAPLPLVAANVTDFGNAAESKSPASALPGVTTVTSKV